MCPTGCRVQGLITKYGKEFVSRMETAKQSSVTSNTQNKISISELKQLHQAAERNMLTDKETIKSFAQFGNQLRRRLHLIKLKIKEQAMQIERLHKELQDQITATKRMEVDMDIKIRSCKGSCRNVNFYMTNLDDYVTWKKDLEPISHLHVNEDKNIRYVNRSLVLKNVTGFAELCPLMKEEQLGLFENIVQYSLTLEDDYEETDNTV